MSNTPEQQQIDHWLKVARDGLTQTEEDFKSGFYEAENISIESVHTGTAMLYASLARAKFLNGDPIAEVRAEFANAARHILKSFRMAYDETDPDYQGEKADLSAVSETIAIDGLNFALMAADFDLAVELGRGYRDRPDGFSLGLDVNRYVNALAFTVRDRLEDARQRLQAQFDDYARKPPKSAADRNYHSLVTALSGILERDAARFNEGLAAQLKIYQGYARGEGKNTTFEFICDYAVALANLGLRRGLEVTAEHPTLPRGLLIQP
ncbi:hypothetical protein sS8_4118 [Methylocaldum marinum]|uniref:Uncharacterized protein n=1 Tax=Methylocaldum marinum TaxID=1432792 RepID=A0A250KWI9_9GAMM|nr:Imm49 family immunity protein [Methylocaldum marinum]BBA36048.1 hypothetical protein sS8_4118 [Methylocaldum marinum]